MEFRNEIKSIDEWFKLAPPKGKEKQWKPKHSAMELAKYIVEDNKNQMPAEIQQIVNGIGLTDDCYCWMPEYVTGLPGKGGGRNHDLAIFSESAFIGVEAKVDEPYDIEVSKWLAEGGENRKKRINDLCRIITGRGYNSCYDNLRYQLFSGLAGTIQEAKKQEKKIAVFLIIDFLFNKDTEVERNKYDFDHFCQVLGIGSEKSKCSGSIAFWGKLPNIERDCYIVKILLRK